TPPGRCPPPGPATARPPTAPPPGRLAAGAWRRPARGRATAAPRPTGRSTARWPRRARPPTRRGSPRWSPRPAVGNGGSRRSSLRSGSARDSSIARPPHHAQAILRRVVDLARRVARLPKGPDRLRPTRPAHQRAGIAGAGRPGGTQRELTFRRRPGPLRPAGG